MDPNYHNQNQRPAGPPQPPAQWQQNAPQQPPQWQQPQQPPQSPSPICAAAFTASIPANRTNWLFYRWIGHGHLRDPIFLFLYRLDLRDLGTCFCYRRQEQSAIPAGVKYRRAGLIDHRARDWIVLLVYRLLLGI